MLFTLQSRRFLFRTITLSLILGCFQIVMGQVEDVTDGETDPIKLFERGQNAHAKGDLTRALGLYEAAIKLRPEFPEAEYQRGVALIALDHPTDAEQAFKRAIDLRKDWALPYRALGNLLARLQNDKEAEPILRHALQLGATDFVTFDSLSTIRSRAGDNKEALMLAQRATEDADASASAWAWRATMEEASENKSAALTSLDRALQIEPKHVVALKQRAALRAEAGEYERAIEELKAALATQPGNKELSLELARVYQRANKPEEARRVYESLGYEVYGPGVSPDGSPVKGVVAVLGAPEDIAAANNEDPKIAVPALEKLLLANPKNAALWGRLGEVTRRTDPQKSADAFRHANEIDPTNPKYATGYAAALVQSRRFAEAIPIFRKVINKAPNEYPAHANLALALYELKDYAAALPEYEWLAAARPEIAATYFFLATAHDKLGEYAQALDAYEKFLSRADPNSNKLDIEKVNLRLPGLRAQIKRGQGRKQKRP